MPKARLSMDVRAYTWPVRVLVNAIAAAARAARWVPTSRWRLHVTVCVRSVAWGVRPVRLLLWAFPTVRVVRIPTP